MNFDPHIELSCTDESYTLYRDALTEVDRGSVLKVGTHNGDSRSLTCGNGSRAAAGNNGCRSTTSRLHGSFLKSAATRMELFTLLGMRSE